MKDIKKKVERMRKRLEPEWYSFPLELLNMVCSNEEERMSVVKNFLVFLDFLDEEDEDYSDLPLSIDTFVCLFYLLDQVTFLRAWTYAIASFNYAKAVHAYREKQRREIDYIR